MAIDTSVSTSPRTDTISAADRIGDVAMTAVRSLASLRLTVTLFALATFLILVGTLAQAEESMWAVIKTYFSAWVAWVDFRIFFPKTFFPNMPEIPRGYGFPFPAGKTIGLLMLANLLTAHIIRFKIQARGGRLAAGLLVTAIGVAVTWLVIASGHNEQGLQGQPPLSWDALWVLFEVGVGAVALVAGVAAALLFVRDRSRLIEAIILAVLSGFSLLMLIYFLGTGSRLGDSAMRIMWQLQQGTVASLALLAGCLLLFRKRAGVVLLHAGVVLIMVGELMVGLFAVEEQMVIEEGREVAYARDIRSVELAVVDTSPSDHDQVVTVPMTIKETPTQFVREGRVRDERLPFEIQVLKFYRNATLVDAVGGQGNLATRGIGRSMVAQPLRTRGGAEADAEVDFAAAYVRLTDRETSRDLGTYMLSQLLAAQDINEEVELDGKTYELALRFKRNYKPYSLRLLDVRKDDYIGTESVRNFSSEIQLTDASRNVDREVRIWMNNPLRYSGETFYQSGYRLDSDRGVEITTLQIVTNTGWMIPYVACMIVGTGMLAHFWGTLLRFLRRQTRAVSEGERAIVGAEVVAATAVPAATRKSDGRKRRGGGGKRPVSEQAPPLAPPPLTPWLRLGLPIGLVGLCILMVAAAAVPREQSIRGFQIDRFGRLPVAYQGRVKPYDTVARSSLRVLSNRDYYEDENEEKQPAILWLLDVMSHSDAALNHRIFRIDNLEVLEVLDLQRRKHFRYAFSEFQPRMAELQRQVQLARNMPEEEMGIFERKILDLNRKVQLFYALRESHRVPQGDLSPLARANQVIALGRVAEDLRRAEVPYPVPTGLQEEDAAWEPLAPALARNLVLELARELDAETPPELAAELSRNILLDPDQVERMARANLLQMIEQILANADPSLSPDAAAAQAEARLEQMPDDMRENFMDRERREILSQGERIADNLVASVRATLGTVSLDDEPRESAQLLGQLMVAYRDGNPAEFNRLLDVYELQLDEVGPAEYVPTRTRFEAYFHAFNPFRVALTLYVFAFLLAAFAWLGWNRPLNRASFWMLVVALLVHTFALVARIYISGRPPVTNLYSSAVFIGWGCAIMALIMERFYKLGVGNIVASVAGFSTLLIAYLLNTTVPSHQGDTFTVMQAVLDTQFWLATHVVCITLGYSATFLAGLLAIVYIFVGLFSSAMTKTISREIYRMTYGILCFAIFFSFIGTVLGGLWADDSWGRFWGWDPKENGALIIVLWNALILHARWGGMIKERGLAVLAVGGNIVTAWSWFGVNELGIGLHSYGFTEGVLKILGIFVASMLCVMVVGMIPTRHWRGGIGS